MKAAASRSSSPSKRKMNPRSAPHSLTELSATVSNTARRSNAERLMTSSTSAVAVCCSSDSEFACCSASNSRVFSMAMTAWSAKVVNQLDLLVGKGTNFLAGQPERPDQFAFVQHRNGQ